MRLSSWKRWLNAGKDDQAAGFGTIAPGDDNAVLYGIGDVHGCDELLAALHVEILNYHTQWYADRPIRIVHVGDYVDRGPDSLPVIDRLMAGIEGVELICLRGNHDDYLLGCSESRDRNLWTTWLNYGGEDTLQSLGVTLRGNFDPTLVEDALGPVRINWLRRLPYFYCEGGYLFVHAGIRPGVPLEEQEPRHMTMIRGPFLEHREDFGFVVIHGHTPVEEPEVLFNRINIDTGAVFGGPLTAVILDGSAPRFMSV